jgi:hypothetical protein
MAKPLHPAAQQFIVGLSGVVQKALQRAAESVLEDVESAAVNVEDRAKTARVKVRCLCRCTSCIEAKKNRSLNPEDHCNGCGFAVLRR